MKWHTHQWGLWRRSRALGSSSRRLCITGWCPMGQSRNGRVFVARPTRVPGPPTWTIQTVTIDVPFRRAYTIELHLRFKGPALTLVQQRQLERWWHQQVPVVLAGL